MHRLRLQLAVFALIATLCIHLFGKQESSPNNGSQDQVGAAYKVRDGVSPPRVISATDPQYSKEARKARVEGTVLLWLIVGPDGLAHDIKVARSLGHGLDQTAIEAVRTWKFKPGLKDGRPVPVQINVELNFRLR